VRWLAWNPKLELQILINPQSKTNSMANIGKITQVIGSTFDAEFSESSLPAIYNAVTAEIDSGGQKRTLTGEISKHLGGGRVRCVALGSTEGLRRGADCVDTGSRGDRSGR
jgi:F-type H+-transporting ATPase subunit beta